MGDFRSRITKKSPLLPREKASLLKEKYARNNKMRKRERLVFFSFFLQFTTLKLKYIKKIF